jgi:FixJ family two-component response regulator
LSCPNIRNTSCLIVDAHMPRMTGIELHRRLVESSYAIPTILSGYLDDSVRARALADGIICYLTKPCDEDALFGCVSSAMERAKPDEYRSRGSVDRGRKSRHHGPQGFGAKSSGRDGFRTTMCK